LKTILNKAQSHFDQNLPFVIYKKPNDLPIIGIFQFSNNLFLINDYTEKGFAFCSFDGQKNILIPENQAETITAEMTIEKVKKSTHNNKSKFENQKQNFIQLVSNGIKAINKNQIDKIVLSRKEQIELSSFDFVQTFKNNINNYPSAFCYCFYHPQAGLWLGATPEQLLQIQGNNLRTVSLAGTQKVIDDKKPLWKKKEIQEQKFVTDYIIENLQTIGLNPTQTEPFTAQAGTLFHLKTSINAKISDGSEIKKIIDTLHPTPAVCGLPKEKSKEFILKNEGYDRQFYTGFLGELNIEKQTDLFVNLRCMKIENNVVNIFVGCGITKDSNPDMEWEETVHKSITMKNNFEF
jgi:isochorismate synthase